MDNDDFLNAFMKVDILAVEGVSEIIGRIIAKLHIGMTEAGLQDYMANMIIASAFEALIAGIAKWEPK